MPRTTIDLDAGVMRELRRRKRASGQSLGQLASELLTRALVEPHPERPAFHWRATDMGARVDLDDKEALRRALEGG